MNPDVYGTMEFAQLGVQKEFILTALDYFGFTSATPVQEMCIPKALTGENMIVQAKNGTGKTLAFSLIALESIVASENSLQVMVLTSVREVASQICDFLNEMTYSSEVPIYSILCCGGYSRKDTISAIKQGVHIAIGTIGRIKDLTSTCISLEGLKLLILDEADKICTECEWIYPKLSKTCQILAFSATFNSTSFSYLSQKIPNPNILKCSGDDQKLHELQEFFAISQSKPNGKFEKVLEILQKIPFHQCIIFHNFKGIGKDLATKLRDFGYPSLNISSELSQEKRIEVIRSLRFLKVKVMLSTDISSRGLDVLNVNLVINYDVPGNREGYVHRIGRAGRFGTPGVAVTICKGLEEVELVKKYSETDVKELEMFDKGNYVPRVLCEEEKALMEEDDSEWQDIPSSESPEKTFNIPVTIGDLDNVACALCQKGWEDIHCHCSTCKYNYELIVKYS